MPFPETHTYPRPRVPYALFKVGQTMVPRRGSPLDPRLTACVAAERIGAVGGMRARHVGEGSQHDEANGREACADHADIDLDGGPVYNVPLVPGRVGRVCPRDERAQAQDGNDGDAGRF